MLSVLDHRIRDEMVGLEQAAARTRPTDATERVVMDPHAATGNDLDVLSVFIPEQP